MAAAFLLCLCSCSKEVQEAETYGYVDISMAEDGSLELVPAGTKADELSDVIAIEICDYRGEPVVSAADYTTLSNPMEMLSGKYTAKASSGELKAASFDAPFYYASADFTIFTDRVTPLALTLTQANVKVTANISQRIRDNFKSFVLTVSNGEGELVYDMAAGTLSKVGYFGVTGKLSYSLSLTNNQNQTYGPITESFTDVKAKQHYALSFDVGEVSGEVGAGEFSLIISNSQTIKEHNILIDFNTAFVPVFDWSFAGDLNLTGGEPVNAEVEVSMKKTPVSLLISHHSAVLAAAGLDYETELVGADAQLIDRLAGIGIRANSLTASDLMAVIDFSDFLPYLAPGTYEISLYAKNEEKDFTESFKVNVKGSNRVQLLSAKPWTRHAEVEAKWTSAEQPEVLGFAFKAANGAWTYVTDVQVDATAKTYSASLYGMNADTHYQVAAIYGSRPAYSAIASIQTGVEQYIPNMNFDGWYQSGKIWYPNTSSSEFYWDTANGGSDALSIYPTVPETSLVVKGKAARLESKSVTLVGIAAGNIYSGRFVKAHMSLSNPGADLDWGVPFSARPLALKGWYHYLPKNINVVNKSKKDTDELDTGQIQILLTDWPEPFRISTKDGKFVDFANDPQIIAYATMDLTAATGEYTEFELPLVYRSDRTPKYIVVVASASKKGDYFTGGVGSVLYLDEFDLIYDPQKLSK